MATATQLGDYTATRSNLFSIEPKALYVDWSKNLSRNGEEPPVDDDLIKLALSMMPRSDENTTGVEQLNPITCRKNDDDVIEAILGYTRLRAALWLVESGTCPTYKISYVVKKLSDKQAALANMNENLHRKTPAPIQTAHAIRRMMDEYGMTLEEVSHTIGQSLTWSTNLLKLVTLPQEIQNSLAEHEIGVTAAIELAKLPESVSPTEVYQELKEQGGKITAGRVQDKNPNDKQARGPLAKLKKFLEEKSQENEGGGTLAEMVLQFLDGDVKEAELSNYWDCQFQFLTDSLIEEKFN